MGEGDIKEWLTIPDICERFGIKAWRVYDITRQGAVPVRHFAGKPVLPYRIDADAFKELMTSSLPAKPAKAPPAIVSAAEDRSLKIEGTQKSGGHGKDIPWRA